MSEYAKEVKSTYGARSDIYDWMEKLFFGNVNRSPREGLAQLLRNADGKLLDICFGTGSSSIAIARVNPRFKIIGIDLSQEMMSIGRQKIQQSNINNIIIEQMDATKMKFEANSFDTAIISLAFHEMPQDLMYAVLTEIHRVLKPGGSFYIVEWEKPTAFFQGILFALISSFEPKWFKQFLAIDWKACMQKSGFNFQKIYHYDYTKLIFSIKA